MRWRTLPLLAPLLDIPLPEGAAIGVGARGATPPATGGGNQLGNGGRKVQPVVLAFEDVHWADPTTLDLLRSIAERGAVVPLFIVATTRP